MLKQGVNDILHQDSFVFASLGLMLLALLLCGAALRYLLLHLANPAPDAAHPGRELDIVLYLQGAGLAEQILMDQFDFERFHASMGRLERWLRNCHVPGSAYERIRQLSTYLDVVFRERRRGEGGRKVLHFLLRIYLIGHFCMALLEISRSLERVSGICMLCGMLLIICGYLIAARNRWRFDNIGPEIHMELALRYYREVEDLDPGRLAMKRRRAKLPLRRNHFEAFQA